MLSLGLEASLCVLFFWRGASKRLPIFTGFLIFSLVTVCACWIVFRVYGFWSYAAYDVGWISSGILIVAEWLVTAELCWRGFRAYRGIWALIWRFLLGLSAVLLLHATYGALKQSHRIGSLILALHRDLALASAAILVTILIIERYYQLGFGPLERRISIGLCAYFITVVLSNSLVIQWFMTHWPAFSGHPPSVEHLGAWWNGAQLAVSDAVLGAWCFALRKPLPAPKPEPTLLPPETYGELSPAINYRLRALNARLIDLLKT
jgi:hypothetical protein